MSRAAPRSSRGTFATLTRLLLRLQRTTGRLVLAGAVGAALMAAALAINAADGGRDAVVGLLGEPVFVIAVPLVSLVFAVASLGELRDDETLVYVWLRPVARWRLAVAAWLATLQLALPLNLGIVAGVTLLGGHADLLAGAAAATAAATVAYVGAFVALGLFTQRSLPWGLGYVLLVEGFLARFSEALSAISVRRYTASLFDAIAGVSTASFVVPAAAALMALALIAVAGMGLAVAWLRTRDIP